MARKPRSEVRRAVLEMRRAGAVGAAPRLVRDLGAVEVWNGDSDAGGLGHVRGGLLHLPVVGLIRIADDKGCCAWYLQTTKG